MNLEQLKRVLDTVQNIENEKVRNFFCGILRIMAECVLPWDLVLWYNRLDASLELAWELRVIDENIYARLKGTTEDYYMASLRILEAEKDKL